jgi:hypothetical protein
MAGQSLWVGYDGMGSPASLCWATALCSSARPPIPSCPQPSALGLPLYNITAAKVVQSISSLLQSCTSSVYVLTSIDYFLNLFFMLARLTKVHSCGCLLLLGHVEEFKSWSSHNSYLINHGQKRSRNDIQDLGLLAKCGCRIYTTIVYWWTADFLVCSVCQKLANCTFISNSRVKTSKLMPDKHIFSAGHQKNTSYIYILLFFN